MSDPAVSVKLESGWKQALLEEFNKSYFQQLKALIVQEKQAGQTIYPPSKYIFHAFDSTPFDQGPGSDYWAGSLSWTWTSPWPMLFRSTWDCHSPFVKKYL